MQNSPKQENREYSRSSYSGGSQMRTRRYSEDYGDSVRSSERYERRAPEAHSYRESDGYSRDIRRQGAYSSQRSSETQSRYERTSSRYDREASRYDREPRAREGYERDSRVREGERRSYNSASRPQRPPVRTGREPVSEQRRRPDEPQAARRPASRPAARPAQKQAVRRPAKGKAAEILDSIRAMVGKNPRLLLFAGAGAIILALVIVLIVVLARPAQPDTLNMVATMSSSSETVESIGTETESVVPEATVMVTPVPTQKPLPTMIPEFQVLENIPNTDRALGLPESIRVDDSYFNDAVFIGDSVSKKLELYVTNQRKRNPTLLGNAVFLTTQSFSSRHALKDVSENSLHPTYKGLKMKVEDAIVQMGAKKVFIMLGMNDVGINGVNDSAKNLFTLLRQIKDKAPDVQIFVQSATPRVSGSQPTTEQLFKYDLKVYEYCQKYTEYGIYFVDVAYAMRDPEGKLYENYCSDLDSMALHFTNEGCEQWIEYLYTHALV